MTARKTALVLRVCDANMGSKNGFVWPTKGKATAPDWNKRAECGHGLHGWLYGAGDPRCAPILSDSKWLVVRVALADLILLDGKCKFPEGTVQHVGDRKSATEYLLANEPSAKITNVIGASLQVGDKEIAVVGPLGTATAGYRGTATAGENGTATVGKYGTAIAGKYGTATAGYRGTATAGNFGTATVGESGTATAGYRGTAIVGESGTATAGESGEIQIKWYDSKHSRYRTVVGYVGEGGIKADTKYQLNDKHQLVEAKS